MTRYLAWGGVFAVIGVLAAAVALKASSSEEQAAGRSERRAPVEVAEVRRQAITETRRLAGSLEPSRSFIAAPKVGGRIAEILVDIGDPVERGQVVARLDDEEWRLAVEEAEAEWRVAQASLEEAQRTADLRQREFDRLATLAERRSATQAALEAAELDAEAARSRVEVARAQAAQREAAVRAARVRLSHAEVVADWRDGGSSRIVGERFADEGDTVAANTPIISILDLSELRAVVFVTEADYPRLALGQEGTVHARSLPGEEFDARISRLAPLFQATSRQARIEALVGNPGHRLKPGMFVTLGVDLQRVEDAAVIPRRAVATREGRDGVFLLVEEGSTVDFVPVRLGIVDGADVQVAEPADLEGAVVVLGQHLLSDGARVAVRRVER